MCPCIWYLHFLIQTLFKTRRKGVYVNEYFCIDIYEHSWYKLNTTNVTFSIVCEIFAIFSNNIEGILSICKSISEIA